MRLFLINLFTTLQSQRTTIRDKSNFVDAALRRDEMTPYYIEFSTSSGCD